jgi:UDP-N-acetylglucosamine--N-acetylmuramyl-(pentapeptide) pyrophosphoryl-undecaprenol N-acetylglucosamine transferase
VFVGTTAGLEARLVPREGYRIEWISIGGLKRVGFATLARTLWQLPAAVARVWRLIGSVRPKAVFSMGGYVAGPVVVAAWLRNIPIVAMEPNAMPGMTNRLAAALSRRVLLGQPEAAQFFDAGKVEVTGYPVREEFFHAPEKEPGEVLQVLITGGSQGSRRLNEAFRESWPLFRASGQSIRFQHQAGVAMAEELAAGFAASGLAGEVVPFVQEMPAAFAKTDLVVCRSGAGAVAELAAAGKPSILVPFPFAADDHQTRNAEAMARGGAARVVADKDLDGRRFHEEIVRLAEDRTRLRQMGKAARGLGRPGSAARAADILVESAAGKH